MKLPQEEQKVLGASCSVTTLQEDAKNKELTVRFNRECYMPERRKERTDLYGVTVKNKRRKQNKLLLQMRI